MCTSRICRISFVLVSANGDLKIPDILAMNKKKKTLSMWPNSYVKESLFCVWG